MRIKIGNRWHDGKTEPIMVELEENDKENIKNMPENLKKYCECPESYTEEEIRKWMEI